MVNFFSQRQKSIFSAATLISTMMALSRLLGLLRNRVLAHFFSAEEISLYFAAFRLPEVVFDVLVFGAISAAFIPTFITFFARNKKEAWEMTATISTLAIIIFVCLSLFVFFFSQPLYQLMLPSFKTVEIQKTTSLARILFLAQGFFLLSYFLTGILESLQRFFVPAIAPVLYNLSIITGTIIFSQRFGLYGPVLGAVIGAGLHFLIQFPLALSLGLKPKIKLNFSHPGLKRIIKLATPRVFELSILELRKIAELFFSSLVSGGAYAWFTFANSLQLLPVALFGTSIAKATLPTLSSFVARQEMKKFKKVFLSSFNQILFLAMPASVFLTVLRIPVVRLAFGAARFTWQSTVETGYTLSAFSLSIFAESLNLLLARAFYALYKTKTAVKISVVCILTGIVLNFLFILVFHLPIWGLALSFSLASLLQFLILLHCLDDEVGGFPRKNLFQPFLKISFSSLFSGSLMYFLLKIFDRSAWDKRLSFLGKLGLALPTTFERFVLDTRYTINLIILLTIVSLAGITTYLVLAYLFQIEALIVFKKLNLFKRRKILVQEGETTKP